MSAGRVVRSEDGERGRFKVVIGTLCVTYQLPVLQRSKCTNHLLQFCSLNGMGPKHLQNVHQQHCMEWNGDAIILLPTILYRPSTSSLKPPSSWEAHSTSTTTAISPAPQQRCLLCALKEMMSYRRSASHALSLAGSDGSHCSNMVRAHVL